MPPTYWSKKIKSCIESISEDMFNGDLSNINDNLDDLKIPFYHVSKAMNKASKFYDLSYWKEFKLEHLLDLMYVSNNVANSIWKHISSTKKKTNAFQRKIYKKKKQPMWMAKTIIMMHHRHCLRMKKMIHTIRTPT
jgi:hypothetical protein